MFSILWTMKHINNSSNITKTINSLPDNYASANVEFSHPLRIQFRKNPFISNERPMPRECITTWVWVCLIWKVNYMYLLSTIISPLGNNNCYRINNFSTGMLTILMDSYGKYNSCRIFRRKSGAKMHLSNGLNIRHIVYYHW